MCPSAATCLTVDCCCGEVIRYKSKPKCVSPVQIRINMIKCNIYSRTHFLTHAHSIARTLDKSKWINLPMVVVIRHRYFGLLDNWLSRIFGKFKYLFKSNTWLRRFIGILCQAEYLVNSNMWLCDSVEYLDKSITWLSRILD